MDQPISSTYWFFYSLFNTLFNDNTQNSCNFGNHIGIVASQNLVDLPCFSIPNDKVFTYRVTATWHRPLFTNNTTSIFQETRPSCQDLWGGRIPDNCCGPHVSDMVRWQGYRVYGGKYTGREISQTDDFQ